MIYIALLLGGMVIGFAFVLAGAFAWGIADTIWNKQ